MTEREIVVRCRRLESEIHASEQEIWHMQNELNDLYQQLNEVRDGCEDDLLYENIDKG